MKPFINSETAPLKHVLLHRPDLSFLRLTPENCREYLFDDVVWLKKIQEEHDIFASALKNHSVEVYYFSQLLLQVLEIPEAREWILAQAIKKIVFGIELSRYLKEAFYDLESEKLLSCFLAGVTVKEFNHLLPGFIGKVLNDETFLFPPLPNLVFTRDIISVIFEHISINSMALIPRKPESLFANALLLFSPLFNEEKMQVIEGRTQALYKGYKTIMPAIEGGDIMVLSSNCILIGMGQRTSPQAIELLAVNLFKYSHHQDVTIVVIELPRMRATMHLDTVLTMIDNDTFCVFSPVVNEHLRYWTIQKNKEGHLKILPITNLFKVLGNCLEVEQLRIITPTEDKNAAQCEQWNDGINLLTVKPGTVICYDRNDIINDILKREGIDLITIPSSELGRGRGGTHCMTCPILRANAVERL